MSKSANSGGQFSNSDSTSEQAAADQLQRLMTGLATAAFDSDFLQGIATAESTPYQYSKPSVDTIPIDTETTSRDEMLHRIQGAMNRRQFVTWRSDESGMYSSAFVEPFTKEVFLSGDLTNRTSALHDGGLVWYSNKDDAEEAAVARCLDCVELREGSPRPFGLRVKEPPYKVGKGQPYPLAMPGDVKSRLGMEVELHDVDTSASALSSEISSTTPDQQEFDNTPSIPRARSNDCHPISMLTEFYRSESIGGSVMLTKKNFVTWCDGEPHIRKFTSAFVCPVSGEIFPSGRWMRWKDSCYEMNGQQWYSTKKKAEAAAAAVAHDCLCFRNQFANYHRGLDCRFCIEDPYREGSRSEEDFIESIPFEAQKEIQKLQRTLGR